VTRTTQTPGRPARPSGTRLPDPSEPEDSPAVGFHLGRSLGVELDLGGLAGPVLLYRENELEPCPVRVDVLVDKVAVVRARVRPRDRQTEACAAEALAATGEALEKLRNELRRDTVAVILNGNP